jgi:hypothetical protein
MNKLIVLALAGALGALGCNSSTEPTGSGNGEQPAEKTTGKTVPRESAWTWGYFFAPADAVALRKYFADGKPSLTRYRVEKVVRVRGEPGIRLAAGSSFVRVEIASRLPGRAEARKLGLLMQGVPQHLEYTSRAERDDLTRRSRAPLPAGKDTLAVVIPIRKSAAWWALAQDERNAYFQKQKGHKGHTAIGAEYVDRVYRKLYHTRYAVQTRDHDFITYFEFRREHEGDFKRLLAKLRDVKQNPEWKYVDREYEIWLTKVE